MDYKLPHIFEPDGSKGVNNEPLCKCGLNNTYSIHDPELVKEYFPTPPVNESWEVEFQKEMMLLCWEIEKLPASEQQTKTTILAGKIKDNLKKFFGEQATLLSTARQEATLIEKEVSDLHKQLYDSRFWRQS